MKRYVLSIFIIFCWVLTMMPIGLAEIPANIRGVVKDAESGEPIAGAIVKAKGLFTSTDSDGRFVMKLKADTDSVYFRSMGYASLMLPATADMSDVRLSRKETQLNDVVVEAPDIFAKGDTLVFNVARYANAKDNAIIDVIKRLPGIKVKDDGTIEYQGKPISKFYIDGNDFVGGQYGLATDNISHKDVKSVEVMERHQPVKALEGIEFPEEAGINLTLKEDARSRWVGVAKAAAGVQPFLYDGSLFSMRMARKVQNMFTLKADNTGWNPANEIRDHSFGEMFSWDYKSSLWHEYIKADIISVPLSEKRTRDNLSWIADAITAWKSDDTSMRLKLNYMGDRLDFMSGVKTAYFSELIPVFSQSDFQHKQSHDFSLQFNSETNKRGYYLKDRLTLSGSIDRSNSVITGSFDLSQKVDRKGFSAVNDLKLVRRNERRLFSLTSRNSFSHHPDRLFVYGSEDMGQTIASTDFRSTTETGVGRFSRFWKYYLNAGIDLDFHRMKSILSGLGGFDSNGVHEAFLSCVYAVPQIDYDRNGWRMSVRVPLKWWHYSVAGQHDYINVLPRISVWKRLTSKSELSGSLSYGIGSPQAYLCVDAPVLSDYRNLFIAGNPGGYSHESGLSVSYGYRNPIRSLFFNISSGYGRYRNSLMLSQKFIDDFIISTYADRVSRNDTWYFKGGFSKGLGHSRMVIGVEGSTNVVSASSMRDDDVIPYTQSSFGVKPYFKGTVLKWLSVNYEADYGYSILAVDGMKSHHQSLHQNLFATVSMNDRVHFTFGAEHFLTMFPEGNTAALTLIDASAIWNAGNKIRLSLTANNLIDKRRYEYVTYGTLSRSEHAFNIRPRSILASIQYRF